MPMSRAPDIAAPDAIPARKFNLLVDNFLKTKDESLKNDIKEYLLGWIENDKQLKVLAKNNFAVREFLPLSADLARASVVAMQALSPNVDHDNAWRQNSMKIINRASEPISECEIKVITGIQKLIETTK